MKTTKSFLLALIALGCLAVGLLGAFLGLLPPLIGFALFMVGGALGLVAVIWGIVAKLRKKSRGGALAVIVGLVPLLLVAVPAAIMSGKSGPGINDITTDATNPPQFVQATLHGSYPEGFGEKAAEAYPEIKPLELLVDVATANKLATELAEKTEGWNIVHSDENGFEAYQKSRLFHFRDDFVVRFRDNGTGKTIVDMRSASRDGRADFGVNAARISTFLKELAAKAR